MNQEDKKKVEINEAMKSCLSALSNGKSNCEMDYPNFRKIKVEIIGVDLTNISYEPIHVRILEKGLKQETQTVEDDDSCFGGWDYEKPKVLVKKQISFTDAWVDVRWLSNFK